MIRSQNLLCRSTLRRNINQFQNSMESIILKLSFEKDVRNDVFFQEKLILCLTPSHLKSKKKKILLLHKR